MRQPADARGRQRKDHQRRQQPARRPERDARITGKQRGHPHQQRQQQRGGDQVARRGQAAGAVHGIAEQGGGAHLFGAGQGPERKDQRGQQAIKRRLQQRAGIDGKDHRHRQGAGDDRGKDQRDRRAKQQPQRDAQHRQGADLQEIGQKDRVARGAKRAQRGDDGGLARQIGPHRRRHADAAHGEARQAHQHQKPPQPVDEPGNSRRAVAGIAPAHAAVAVARLGLGLQRVQIAAGRQQQAILRLVERSGGQQTAFRQRGSGHQRARAQPEPVARIIRFAQDDRRQGELLLSQPEAVAGA